jgi:hypothetical protein
MLFGMYLQVFLLDRVQTRSELNIGGLQSTVVLGQALNLPILLADGILQVVGNIRGASHAEC